VTTKKEEIEPRRIKSLPKTEEKPKKKTPITSDESGKGCETPRAKRTAGEEASTKKNNKRKLNESELDEKRPTISRNKSILVGDLVKVYYGSTNETNVYEAKVGFE